MKLHVDSWQGNVRMIDSESLLTPQLQQEIVRLMWENLDHQQRVRDERTVKPAVSARQQRTWGR